MCIVALEEHLTLPHLSARIGRECILACGMTPPAVARGEQLRDIGAARLANMVRPGSPRRS